MIKAEPADKVLIIDILSQAFKENQSVNYIVRNDEKRSQRIEALMDYSFEVCSLFGKVWLSEDRNGCALILYPQNKRTTLKAIWLDIVLIFKAIGLTRIGKALDREAKIKEKQLKADKVYLWFIGIEPASQNEGTGSKLLADVIKKADAQGLPVYLETSTLKNIPWYEKFGFQIYDQLEIGYTLFFLKRDPDNI